jgi:hypothetical protein
MPYYRKMLPQITTLLLTALLALVATPCAHASYSLSTRASASIVSFNEPTPTKRINQRPSNPSFENPKPQLTPQPTNSNRATLELTHSLFQRPPPSLT